MWKELAGIMNPTRWAILGGVLLALVVAGGAAMATVYSNGKEAGAAKVQALRDADALADAKARTHDALAYTERVITLTSTLSELKNAYTTVAAGLIDARSRASVSGQRVRDATPAGGELDQRLAAAECPVVRAFGANAFRTAVSCRGHLAEIGLGPGGLVETSASEHYQAGRADALIRFSMPRSPFTKP